MDDKNVDTDVIIVGAGPAGLSAAIWCAELRLSTIVFDKAASAGGQLTRIYNPVTNYIGINTNNGKELCDLFIRSFEMRGLAVRLAEAVTEIQPAERSVITNSFRFRAHALILASGVRRRSLNIPGEDEFRGRGVLDSGAKEKDEAAGKTAVIIGGGDAALENALILAEHATKVYVVHRGSALRARYEFERKAIAHPQIEFYFESVVNSINGASAVESVDLTDLKTGDTRRLRTDLVLARIGVQPNTEMLNGKVDLDKRGYVVVNSVGETSVSGVYAIGDVANPLAPTISTAVGTGATAAKAIYSLLINARDPDSAGIPKI